MNYSMMINGFDTSSLRECVVTDIGKIQSAKFRRSESVQIYGANGTYDVFDGAFESYERSFEFFVKYMGDVQLLLQQFTAQNNELEFGYLPGSFFYADFVEAEFEPLGVNAWKVVVKVQMHPFRYTKDDSTVVLTGSGSITNPGNVYSEPVVTVEGHGDVVLTIGTTLMEFTVNGKVVIDCRHKMQNLYNGNGEVQNTLRKRGGFFELKPGISGVYVSGEVTRITIQGNWRYLV